MQLYRHSANFVAECQLGEENKRGVLLVRGKGWLRWLRWAVNTVQVIFRKGHKIV
jgi:hypothetical protein